MDHLLLTTLLGAIVGLVLSLTGAGGGVLAVPLLVFGLGLSIQQAAPLSLLAVGGSAALGALMGWHQGILRYRAAALIGTMAMVSAPVGIWLAHQCPQRPLLAAFAVVLAWTARRMWRMASDSPAAAGEPPRQQPCRVNPSEGRLRWTAPCAWVLAATGLVSGLLTGLLGVGGGFVIVPSLTRYTDLDMRSIAATSLAVIALATLSGLLAASGHGTLDGSLALAFGGAAMVALLTGQRMTRNLPAKLLQRAFALVSLVVAVMMLARSLGWLQR